MVHLLHAASDLCMMALTDSSMPQKKTMAFDPAEPVSRKGINMTSTVVADVGLTERCT